MIIYDITSGEIIAKVSDDQTIDGIFYHYPKEFKDKLNGISLEPGTSINLREYRIIKNELVKKSQLEIDELAKYGKTLTENEREEIRLMPPYEEVQKAERTIEMLELLEGMGVDMPESVTDDKLTEAYTVLVLAKRKEEKDIPKKYKAEVDIKVEELKDDRKAGKNGL